MTSKPHTPLSYQRYWFVAPPQDTATGDDPLPKRAADVLDEYGFLRDPEEWLLPKSSVLTLDTLDDCRAVVLTGVSGSGKTEALKAEEFRLKSPTTAVRKRSLQQPLQPESIAQMASQPDMLAATRIYLLLDAFDELSAEKPVEHLDDILAEANRVFGDRLYVRVACKSSLFSEKLADCLTHRLGDCVRANLLPLRRSDVWQAAEQLGLDAAAFFNAVAAANAYPLASIPLDLDLLLADFAEDGKLSNSRGDLYEAALRKAQEQAGLATWKTDDLRRILGALACRSLFSGQTALCFDASKTPPPTVVTADDIGRLAAATTEDRIPATPDTVLTFRKLGFFVDAGDGYHTWRHQSFVDYFAARALRDLRNDVVEVLGWTTAILNGQHAVIPRYRGVVSWLAAADTSALDAVLAIDPSIVLDGDAGILTDEQKSRVVAGILRQTDEVYDFYERLQWLGRKLRALDCPSTRELCRSTARDPSRSARARELALDLIVEAADPSESEILADLATDDTQPEPVRTTAARGIAAFGTPASRRRLLPLVEPARLAGDGNWLGCLLMAVFPGKPEYRVAGWDFAFENLIEEPQPGLYTVLTTWLHEVFDGVLPPEALPYLCDWVRRNAVECEWDEYTLISRLLPTLWAHRATSDDTRDAIYTIATLTFDRQGRYWEIRQWVERHWLAEIRTDAKLRRYIIERFMADASQAAEWHEHDGFAIAHDWAVPDDAVWAIGFIPRYQDTPAINVITKILTWQMQRAMQTGEQQTVDAVLMAIERHRGVPVIDKELGFWIGTVELDSPAADQMREAQTKRQEWEDEDRRRTEEHDRDVELEWQEIEKHKDNPNAFILARRTIHPFNMIVEMLHISEEYKKLPEHRQALVVETAENFLRYLAKEPLKVTEDNHNHGTVLVADIAFQLLWDMDRTQALGAETLAALAPLVAYNCLQSYIGNVSREVRADVLREMYRVNANGVLDGVRTALRTRDTQGGMPLAVAVFDELGTADQLVPLLSDNQAKPTPLAELYGALMRLGSAGVKSQFKAVLKQRIAAIDGTAKEADPLLVVALKTLPSWTLNLCGRHNLLAPMVCHAIHKAFDHHDKKSLARIEEQDIEALYRHLDRHVPWPTETFYGARSVGEEESLQYLREALRGRLVATGTSEALAALQRLHRDAVKKPAIEWAIQAARQRWTENAWRPIPPDKLDQLLQNDRKRWVADSDDLMNAVMCALQRLQNTLNAAGSEWRQVWNSDTKTGRRTEPQGEEAVSDLVKKWITSELSSFAVTTRETRTRPAGDGEQRYDVIVEMPAPDGLPRVCVIVEVKCVWHKEVPSAIVTQLHAKYLSPVDQNHGVYLVAWFPDGDWAARRGKARTYIQQRATIEQSLRDEANNLSTNGKHVRYFGLDCGR